MIKNFIDPLKLQKCSSVMIKIQIHNYRNIIHDYEVCLTLKSSIFDWFLVLIDKQLFFPFILW